MPLWRVSNHANLDGIGGQLASGRWHTRGRPVVYCSLDPATALLETLVHMEIDAEDKPERFQVLKIEGREPLMRDRVKIDGLPPDWATEIGSTQAIGDAWLASSRTLLLEVPSVLVPEAWNVLVNPLHPEARRLKIAAIYQHPFDARLLR